MWHSHHDVKHIDLKFHHIQERVINGKLLTQPVSSSENTADITKASSGPQPPRLGTTSDWDCPVTVSHRRPS